MNKTYLKDVFLKNAFFFRVQEAQLSKCWSAWAEMEGKQLFILISAAKRKPICRIVGMTYVPGKTYFTIAHS